MLAINTRELIAEVRQRAHGLEPGLRRLIWEIAERLEILGSVDAVPVVRCKDCKHREDKAPTRKFALCNYHSCDRTGHKRYLYVEDNDFCSCGERNDTKCTENEVSEGENGKCM